MELYGNGNAADRTIHLTTGTSRKDMNWLSQETTASVFYARLSEPIRGAETLAEYLAMPKSQQDELKDVGGYVVGELNGTRRKADNVLCRDAVTLDFDAIPAHGTDAVVQGVEALGCGYCLHSTRKHRPEAPRLRVIIVTDRSMTPDEYELVARMIAAKIGITMADPTTFEPSRLMYWPSCCADSEYVYKCDVSKPLLSVDTMLQWGSILYGDWHDMTYWPRHPKETQPSQRGKKQADPAEKGGAIGAFCKLYSVWRVIEELIPDVYDPVDTDPNRFTYHGGTTTGGAIVYDGGKFLYPLTKP